ncbi:MAG: ribosome small subunit-dependent GTPase A [Sphingobacteriales bacterium]|nr:MAG: ribosome small subunit-dependent GTPase A [Sphingobacteriales bacterium]
MKARIIKATGSWYNCLTDDGKIISCRIKGKLRLEERRTTNPVVIGDFVEMEMEENSDNGVINEILKRNNYIIRQGSRHRTAEHILAANLDQSVIVVTFNSPRTSSGFVDRFLVTSLAYHIPAVLVLNKMDLWNDEEKQTALAWKNVYEDIGCKVIFTSAETKENISELKKLLSGKVSLISGHSGAGKSSLINSIYPEMNLRTGELSNWSMKGQHTTTFTEMFPLPDGGFIIDSPGIKEFGILDLEKAEVSQFFPEMERYLHDCKFNNCLHVNEPDCAVKKKLEEGFISPSRYNSYLSILEEIDSDKKIYD